MMEATWWIRHDGIYSVSGELVLNVDQVEYLFLKLLEAEEPLPYNLIMAQGSPSPTPPEWRSETVNVLGRLLTNGSDAGHIQKAESVNVSVHVALSSLEPPSARWRKKSVEGLWPIMSMCPSNYHLTRADLPVPSVAKTNGHGYHFVQGWGAFSYILLPRCLQLNYHPVPNPWGHCLIRRERTLLSILYCLFPPRLTLSICIHLRKSTIHVDSYAQGFTEASSSFLQILNFTWIIRVIQFPVDSTFYTIYGWSSACSQPESLAELISSTC